MQAVNICAFVYFSDPPSCPVVSRCCQSLIGCNTCVTQALATSATCPKCRAAEARDNMVHLRGLDSAFEALLPGLNAAAALLP